MKDTFGAKPAVLRCSRCGKYVDWEDAPLQVVCACRPHLPGSVGAHSGQTRPGFAGISVRDEIRLEKRIA